MCSNRHEIKHRFLICIAIGYTQVLPKVGFVVFRFFWGGGYVEKTYLKLKDFNFPFQDWAPFRQEMCVCAGIQTGSKTLREVDLIH